MKKQSISIVGANSFLGRNFYKYIMDMEGMESENIFLYDVQDKFSDKNENQNYEKIDFLNKSSLEKMNFNVDAILVFIGKTGTIVGFEKYADFIKINEEILLNILNCYNEKKSNAKLIYPSTRLVYKNSDIKVKENAEKELKSVYAITKYAAEQYIQLYHHAFGLQYCIFRICVPFGTLLENNGNYGTFSFFIDNAQKGKNISVYGDGSICKTYTCMGDLCHILFQGVINDKLKSDVFNIGGDSKSLLEIANMIAKKYNVEVENTAWPKLAEIVDGGSVTLDSAKLDKIIDYTYQTINEEFLGDRTEEL
ncbi:MAG: NAD(P)-dependent oxidoreductase [Bacilli bacterium]